MPLLSITLLALAGGCAVHLGVIPANGHYAVLDVAAPVAEADVDTWVQDSLVSALIARHAFDPSGVPLLATVSEAAWEPSRRSGDVLLYQARLVVRLEAGGRTGTQTRVRFVVDPGDAAGARALREATFQALAREAAEDGAAWLAGTGG